MAQSYRRALLGIYAASRSNKPANLPRTLRGSGGAVSSVAFARDDRSLLSAGWDQMLRLSEFVRKIHQSSCGNLKVMTVLCGAWRYCQMAPTRFQRAKMGRSNCGTLKTFARSASLLRIRERYGRLQSYRMGNMLFREVRTKLERFGICRESTRLKRSNMKPRYSLLQLRVKDTIAVIAEKSGLLSWRFRKR